MPELELLRNGHILKVNQSDRELQVRWSKRQSKEYQTKELSCSCILNCLAFS